MRKNEERNITLSNDVVNHYLNEIVNEKDSGKFGKAFEIAVKVYMNGLRGNSKTVASAILKNHVRGTDVQWKKDLYEVKSNCGELDDIYLHKCKYVIYTPDNEIDCFNPGNAYVIPVHDFIASVENCGLKRVKLSSSGHVKTTIQTYRNSKKKTNLWYATLEQFPTLREWVNC